MSKQTQEFVAAAERIAHVRPLTSLEQKVRPAHSALLVIDVQNDFCASGGMVDRGGRDVSGPQEMCKRLPALIDTARRSGVLVIFIKCSYSTDRNAYLSDVWLEQAARKQGGGYTVSPVCTEGSWEADFYGDVRPASTDIVVTKHRYSGFHNTDLDLILRSNGIRSLVLTGLTTNVCVETTARDGFVRDYYVVLASDGTACYTEEEHQNSLATIDRFFGEVASISDLKRIWAGQNE